ncbi:MAG: hypothetical protein NTX15_06670, partial [Candidatus Kapabacteria bacterium]|nr:hypothetical protein [Candidatus Kapabacteria bacterium]
EFVILTRGNMISYFVFAGTFSLVTYYIRSKIHDLNTFNSDRSRPRFRDTLLAAAALIGILSSTYVVLNLPGFLGWNIHLDF